MLYEMTKALELHDKIGLPVREGPDKELPVQEIRHLRKLVRTETDRLLLALAQNDLPGTAQYIAEVSYDLAEIAIQTGARPDPSHFKNACRQLIQETRVVVDRGLQMKDWNQLQVGLAMLHSIVLAMSAALNIPYLAVFNHIHERRLKPEAINPDDIEAVIKAAMEQGLHHH